MSKLRYLELEDVKISDEFTKGLHKSFSLDWITLYGTEVSEEEVERLRHILRDSGTRVNGQKYYPKKR
jgi:hypothetical protein